MTESKAKPTVKKTAAPKATAASKSAVTAKSSRAKKPVSAISDQERYKMIQNAAYFIAERHNFAGDPQTFWTAAEAQISTI
jgi:hypothetical protein